MTIVQWVNLEKDEAYAKDSDIGSVDRCGALSLKALFEKDGVPLNFTVRAVPSGGDNVQYNEEEQKRNPNFRMPTEVIGLGSEKEVLLEDSVKLPAAGGNKYKLEAKDANGTTVESVEVEAKRKLYYQVLTMDDANGSVPAYSLAPMEKHSEKHFITIQSQGKEKKIPYRKTIGLHAGGNSGQFGRDVGSAYDIDAPYKKVGIAVVFSDYIAKMKKYEFVQAMAIGTPVQNIITTSQDVTIVGDKYLWHGLDDSDDNAKKWFIDGGILYTDPASSAVASYRIPRENITITGTPHFTHGGYHQVKIVRDDDLNALIGKSQGTLKFVVRVNIVSGWINGFSWSPGGNDLITCAKRTRWTDMPRNTQEYTWNHEIGHRFGMVAYGHRDNISGYAKLPDGPSTLYGENRGVNDKGHQGPHCENGATYTNSTGWAGTPGCVMFGANGIGSNHSPKEYCGECAQIVRKLDLSE